MANFMIVDAARAASAGSALRIWAGALGDSVDELARGLRSESPASLADGLAGLQPVSGNSVHATGWEVRHALAWRNDDYCVQRAAFTALSLLERESGSIRAAVGELATSDARRAAIAVNYTPNFNSGTMGRARLHTAPVFRTSEGETLVIDHLFADAQDGVLTLAEWMRRTGGREESTRIIGVLAEPPLSLRGGPGIPVSAKPIRGPLLRSFGDHLASSWDTAALQRRPAFEPVRRPAA